MEKTFCKVRDILHNHGNYTAKIEMYLPKGEILRTLTPNTYKLLEELNLDHIGSEFFFCASGTIENPIVTIEAWELTATDIEEANKLFDELEKLIGD